MTQKGKKWNAFAVCSAAAGIVGTLVWSKKDLTKGVMQLCKDGRYWVQIGAEPEVYLTKSDAASQEKLFDYLSESNWKLMDHIADGYFWMNDEEEVLLLSQYPVLMGKYYTWTSSRSFS